MKVATSRNVGVFALLLLAMIWDSYMSAGPRSSSQSERRHAARKVSKAAKATQAATAAPMASNSRGGGAALHAVEEGTMTALVMGDTRSPWPPPPSTNPRLRLLWQPGYYQRAVALASAYARRHCYDLRVYRFTRTGTRSIGKYGSVCTHPKLGARAGSWCKLIALADSSASLAEPHESGGAVSSMLPRHRYSYLVWLDSDAFFHDSSISIHQLLHLYAPPRAGRAARSEVAFFAPNWPWTDSSPANAGFFILRNGQASRELLAKWWNFPFAQSVRVCKHASCDHGFFALRWHTGSGAHRSSPPPLSLFLSLSCLCSKQYNRAHDFEQAALRAMWPLQGAAILKGNRTTGSWLYMTPDAWGYSNGAPECLSDLMLSMHRPPRSSRHLRSRPPHEIATAPVTHLDSSSSSGNPEVKERYFRSMMVAAALDEAMADQGLCSTSGRTLYFVMTDVNSTLRSLLGLETSRADAAESTASPVPLDPYRTRQAPALLRLTDYHKKGVQVLTANEAAGNGSASGGGARSHFVWTPARAIVAPSDDGKFGRRTVHSDGAPRNNTLEFTRLLCLDGLPGVDLTMQQGSSGRRLRQKEGRKSVAESQKTGSKAEAAAATATAARRKPDAGHAVSLSGEQSASPHCDATFSEVASQHNCNLSLLLERTQSPSNPKLYVVASTRCGWTDVAAKRPAAKLDVCGGIGSQLEVELVPTLLLAARLGRRLAFSERNWSYLVDRDRMPSPLWNYGCEGLPAQNDIFAGLHPDASLASMSQVSGDAASLGSGSDPLNSRLVGTAAARPSSKPSDVLTVSWGSIRRSSMDWACVVQGRHPLAAKHGSKAVHGMVRYANRVSCPVLPNGRPLLTGAFSCGGRDFDSPPAVFESVSLAAAHIWRMMASKVRSEVESLCEQQIAKLSTAAQGNGGAGAYLYDMLSLSAPKAVTEADRKDLFNAVHLRASDKGATSQMSHREKALFRAMKAVRGPRGTRGWGFEHSNVATDALSQPIAVFLSPL